ncbi:MAG: VOC family protein [Mycobacterium sp.]
MALHELTSITIGVPNVAETVGYYDDFGLRVLGDGRFATVDGGEQLRVAYSPSRRLLSLTVGVDDRDDIACIARRIESMNLPVTVDDDRLEAVEPIAGFTAVVAVAPRLFQPPAPAVAYNAAGRIDRADRRAPAILMVEPVQPRRLGHVVIGSTDQPATQKFFTDGLGFKISDQVSTVAAFMRCSTDHHNVLVQQAPVNFLHHSSWQVNDVDDIGRGATAMLEKDPSRHVWGLGRHHVGSNFFWYLKDPAGNFSEYYSDMDCIVDDAIWKPEVWEGAKTLFNWGPPPPPSFLMPDDIAAMMTGAHSGR